MSEETPIQENSSNQSPVVDSGFSENIANNIIDELFPVKQDNPEIETNPIVNKEVGKNNQPEPNENGTQPKQTKPLGAGELFEQASTKAFLGSDGQINSQKINDNFFNPKRSLSAFITPVDIEPKEQPKSQKIDPTVEYHNKLSEFTGSLGAEIERRISEGATHEQVLSEVMKYYDSLNRSYLEKKSMKEEFDNRMKEAMSEINEIRSQNVKDTIRSNNIELAAPLEGLVEGMSGMQVLNQFVLSPKYGGQELDRQFKKENPDWKGLSSEDLNKKMSDWFNKKQQDKAEIAHIAEFGRLRWIVDNLKPLLEHSQKIGHSKAVNSVEASRGGIGKIQNATNVKSGEQSAFDKFFEGVEFNKR